MRKNKRKENRNRKNKKNQIIEEKNRKLGGKSLQISSKMYRVWKLYTISSVIWTSQNDLGFSLYTTPSVCCIITTSEDWNKVQRGLSTDVVCYC